jgi:hypothetical protein
LRQLTLEGGHHLHLEQGTSDAVAEAINRFYAAL